MVDPFFFGYGSLVNRATHGYGEAHHGHVAGWRRMWRHTRLRPVAYLTVVPDPGTEIAGLVARVPGGDWAALDQREGAYARVPVAQLRHAAPHPLAAEIYAIPAGALGLPSDTHPVLLSYLDTVVQGYLREFGAGGVADFFATTSGWDAPVLNDRAAPRYPRAQRLEAEERALVDRQLAALGVRVLTA